MQLFKYYGCVYKMLMIDTDANICQMLNWIFPANI